MNDNAYQRIATSSSNPALSSVLSESPPRRRSSYSKANTFWKKWRKSGRFTINVDKLVKMRLRWRTVAKILGGILFFKIALSILGSLVGSDPSDESYRPLVSQDGIIARNLAGANDSGYYQEMVNITEPPPPPPPPIDPPLEAVRCETLLDYVGMIGSAPEVDIWQTLQLGISFGYSAYFDDRLDSVRSVKVMGLADEWLDASPPMCQLWFADRVIPFALPANITNFPAQQTARYKSVMYTCTYTPTAPDMPAPITVSMSSEACSQPLSMFKLHILPRDTPPENKDKFTICLASPMRLNFSEAGEMVDWVEVHKLFGVSKYIMYEHDIAQNVHPFLRYYQDLGEMEVLKWRLPPDIKDPRGSVKAFGQLTMINDCLYRNMYKSKYIIFLDLDEMMVPRGMSKTLEEALVTTSCQDKAQTIIRASFFRKQWTNDEKYASDERMVKRNLVSLLKTKRERKVLAINVHAKYIVIPELIDSVEQLAAMKFLSTVGNNTGEATCVLLAKECLLHHYRYYEEFTGDWMIDRKMHEFTKSIVEKTGVVHEAVARFISPPIENPAVIGNPPADNPAPGINPPAAAVILPAAAANLPAGLPVDPVNQVAGSDTQPGVVGSEAQVPILDTQAADVQPAAVAAVEAPVNQAVEMAAGELPIQDPAAVAAAETAPELAAPPGESAPELAAPPGESAPDLAAPPGESAPAAAPADGAVV